MTALTDDDLDALVSIAIRRAELLEDLQSPAAAEAWHEVMLYEERLSEITDPGDIAGGVARVGAVRAALAAGRRSDARRLAARYLAQGSLPAERRDAIDQAFRDAWERLARRYPALARSGRLAELEEWRAVTLNSQRVFPMAA